MSLKERLIQAAEQTEFCDTIFPRYRTDDYFPSDLIGNLISIEGGSMSKITERDNALVLTALVRDNKYIFSLLEKYDLDKLDDLQLFIDVDCPTREEVIEKINELYTE